MTNPDDDAPFELDRVELVLLKRPEVREEIPDAEAERLQAAHLSHLAAMRAAGHMRAAGPVDEQPDPSLRGLCLYRTGSLERARELAESDPAVIAGRLSVEVMYWYFPKGDVEL